MKLLPVFAFIILIAGCANPIQTTTDYQEGFNFSALETYRWHEPNEYNLKSNSYLANDLIDNRIRESVNAELMGKGYTLKESGQVDFLVNYTITTEDKLDVRTYNTYSGVYPGWSYGRYYGSGPYLYNAPFEPGIPETQVTHYTEGTFVLDIVEADNSKLVWRGVAQGRLKKDPTKEERDERIWETVNRMLANFPPGAQNMEQ
jgi:hypothetical protein